MRKIDSDVTKCLSKLRANINMQSGKKPWSINHTSLREKTNISINKESLIRINKYVLIGWINMINQKNIHLEKNIDYLSDDELTWQSISSV